MFEKISRTKELSADLVVSAQWWYHRMMPIKSLNIHLVRRGKIKLSSYPNSAVKQDAGPEQEPAAGESESLTRPCKFMSSIGKIGLAAKAIRPSDLVCEFFKTVLGAIIRFNEYEVVLEGRARCSESGSIYYDSKNEGKCLGTLIFKVIFDMETENHSSPNKNIFWSDNNREDLKLAVCSCCIHNYTYTFYLVLLLK
jgi:hypothetical protein